MLSKRQIEALRPGDVLVQVKRVDGQRSIVNVQVVEIRYDMGVIAAVVLRWPDRKRNERATVGELRKLASLRRYAPPWLACEVGYYCHHCEATIEKKAKKGLEKGAGHGPTCPLPAARRYRRRHAQLRLF